MSHTRILLASAALLLSVPASHAAFAQAAPVLSKDAAAQASGLYDIDPRHTSVNWMVWHMGASHYTARFSDVSGTLDFNAKTPEKSVLKISIPVASVETGLPDFNKEIAGAKFLGGDKNPTMTFVSTSIRKTAADKGEVTGNLTLNGVTKPVVLNVTFNGGLTNPMHGVQDLGFSADTKFLRSDFGVTQYVPMVSDEVTVHIETEFLQRKSNAR